MPSDLRSGKDFALTLESKLRERVRNPTIDRYIPHEKQVRFHKSTAMGRQYIGGNRAGKTVGGCAEITYYAEGKHPYKELPWEPPLRLRAVTVDLKQGMEKILIPELKRWVPPRLLKKGSWERSWDKDLRTLNLTNGSFIEVLTYEQDVEKFAGTSRHGIWFDEEPPEDIYNECMARLLDVGGHWWMTMTPVLGMSWTYEKIFESKNPDIDHIVVDTDENPYLSDDGKRQVYAGMSEDELKRRKKGMYISLGGLIYADAFDFDNQIIDPITPPTGWALIRGMDHGTRNPTCWLWVCVSEDGKVIVYDEYYEKDLLVYQNAANVNAKEATHKSKTDETVGDPSIWSRDPITGTSIGLEYAEAGLYIAEGSRDELAGIDLVKKLIRQRKLYICSNCTWTIWELKRYRWKVFRQRAIREDRNAPEVPQDKDNHAMDTLRYIISSHPELDTKDDLPVKGNVIGAPEAVPNPFTPNGVFYDTDLVKQERKTIDPHFGEYY